MERLFPRPDFSTKLEPWPFSLGLSFDSSRLEPKELACTFQDGPRAAVVVGQEALLSPDLPLTLFHEAVHVVQAVEDYVGNRLDEESEAYLAEHVAGWLIKKCRKRGLRAPGKGKK